MKDAIESLKNAEKVIILPHISPDSDAVGSCFAMAAALSKIGSSCSVVGEENLPSYLDFLQGDWEIYDENKKYEADVCLCLDSADLGRIAKRKEIFKTCKKVVSIDHHSSNSYYADINWVDGKAPAASVLVYRFIKEADIKMDSYIAENLYAGICGDTGNFKYSNTTSETFMIAADLISYNISHWKISRAIFDTEETEALRLKGELMQNIEIFFCGRVTLVTADSSLLKKYSVDSSNIDALVDIPRCVKGCEIAVSIKETEDGVKVSLRSESNADVSQIAAKFGGGGHVKAAGFFVSDMSCGEVKKRLLDEIEKAL